MTDLMDLTATELLGLYADRALSPVEYMAALVAHVGRWEPHIGALYAADWDAAAREAALSEVRWSRGEPRGPLDGIPVTLKELIATAGVPTPRGTAATRLVPAREDAPPAARLREDGAIIVAKTTCPDLGMLSSGVSSFHPTTRNPWNIACNPGGSSSGAAAAAAARYGPLHIGTDIGGSVRLPAAWSGVFGFKPSHGRVPIDPYYVGRVAGPMTQSVADAALAMRTLSRPDRRDATSLPPSDLPWLDLATELRGLKLGLMLDAGCGLPLDPEIRQSVTAAARTFEAAGAMIEPVGPVLSRAMLDGLDRFWRARAWSEVSELDAANRQRLLPYILRWAEGGAEVSGVEAVRGHDRLFEMRRTCAHAFDAVDAILCPVTPVVCFPAEWASPLDDPDRPFEHIAYTVPWNMGEQPAASIPCGFASNGMPIGFQIVGPRFADLLVLRLSHAYESLRGPLGRWPEPPPLQRSP